MPIQIFNNVNFVKNKKINTPPFINYSLNFSNKYCKDVFVPASHNGLSNISFKASSMERAIIDDKFGAVELRHLSLSSSDDEQVIYKLLDNDPWGSDSAIKMMIDFICEVPKLSLYTIELDNKLPRKNKIVAFMQTDEPQPNSLKSIFFIKSVEIRDDLLLENKKYKEAVLDLCLYKAVKIAKQNNYKKVSFNSKIGSIDSTEWIQNENFAEFKNLYQIHSANYDTFLSKMKEKYNIS